MQRNGIFAIAIAEQRGLEARLMLAAALLLPSLLLLLLISP